MTFSDNHAHDRVNTYTPKANSYQMRDSARSKNKNGCLINKERTPAAKTRSDWIMLWVPNPRWRSANQQLARGLKTDHNQNTLNVTCSTPDNWQENSSKAMQSSRAGHAGSGAQGFNIGSGDAFHTHLVHNLKKTQFVLVTSDKGQQAEMLETEKGAKGSGDCLVLG